MGGKITAAHLLIAEELGILVELKP
jgi:hypothetical protein